ncbi:MAG: glucan biosynthesis protein [Pseudomonadota bacterium]
MNTKFSRRSFLASTAAMAALLPSGVSAQASPTSFLDMARDMAGKPYVPSTGVLPAPFDDLTYDSYRGIRPLPGKTSLLPQGDEFLVDFLPPGFYFTDPVFVERQIDGAWDAMDVTPALFDFDDRYFQNIPATSPGAGFSGLRVKYPLNSPDFTDEVAVMQGASYFRAVGKAMWYGLSARAVAIGTGAPEPEEFPRFTNLRVHEGANGKIRIEALIDSPSLAGYLDMVITPGIDTVMNMSVTLLPRVQIDTIGVAPLTSMFLKGPMHSAASDDFRPHVHDSDVLFVENGAGEMLWRPIANPTHVETSALADTAPKSFGLFQTARDYEDFEDTEARYEHRPSAVVRPKGDWGAGAVMLVELPTGTEFLDNIVAFWRPQDPLLAGQEYRFDYQINWTLSVPADGVAAPIVQSRSGREHLTPTKRRFVIDFDTKSDGLVADLSVSGPDQSVLSGLAVFDLPDDRGTRATFLLEPGDAPAHELRFVLRDEKGAPQSPVWLHRWTRKRDGGV